MAACGASVSEITSQLDLLTVKAAGGDIIEVLETFRWAKEILTPVYYESLALFEQLNQCDSELTREIRGKETVLEFMSSDDKKEFEKLLEGDPVVAVTGTVNSGKTSFINELLGGSFFPTREIPCTARCVRIKYDQRNVLKVRTTDGKVLEEVEFKKKAVPAKYINLIDHEERKDAEEVRKTIEVGLNHDLLKSGLVLVDFPGDSENLALNKMIRECMCGTLQTIIYIIDGNNYLTVKERKLLLEIRTKAPTMKIIFVCNKTDHDAAEFDACDAASDDDDDEPGEITKDKAKDVFIRLQNNQLLPDDLVYGGLLQHFHGISCKKIRDARINKYSNNFMNNFEFLKQSIVQTFCESTMNEIERMSTYMEEKLGVLFKFTAENITSVEIDEAVLDLKSKYSRMLAVIDDFESKSTTKIKMFLMNAMCSSTGSDKLTQALARAICEGHKNIEMQKNREQVIAVMKLTMVAIIRDTVQRCMVAVANEHKKSLQLLSRAYQIDMHLSLDQVDGEWLSELIKNIQERITNSFSSMDDPSKSTDWKRYFAEKIAALVDEKLVDVIVIEITEKYRDMFTKAKDKFEAFRNLLYLIKGVTGDEKKLLQQVRQICCRNLYITKALQQTLKHGYVQLGRSMSVDEGTFTHECHDWGGKKNFLVKKIPGIKEPTHEFCSMRCEDQSVAGFGVTFSGVAFDKDLDFLMLWSF